MRNKIRSLYELARLDKPIGIYLLLWPSLLGYVMAGINSDLKLKNLLIVVIGSIIVRSCGCVINDISDYKIDKLVERTLKRPLALGSISLIEAWLFFLVLAISSIVLLFQTNPLTIKISIFFAFLIMLYPLTKRFFVAPQFILGITFGSGSIIAYSLESNTFSMSLAILYSGIIAWIISFDTYYALEDKDDDERIGVNSTAILWGNNSIIYSKILHIFFYICLLIIGIINSFSYFFYIFFFLLIYLFIRQAKIIKKKNYIEAFKINNWIGIVALVSFVFEIIYLS
jgi:4-hydroxybenzoate polyprenyltransferase|tara:strand:- start:10849 stop:11703 length:855 start_codon:yes stop_codon:yes gene_type:complete